jgi:hypothetical protein
VQQWPSSSRIPDDESEPDYSPNAQSPSSDAQSPPPNAYHSLEQINDFIHRPHSDYPHHKRKVACSKRVGGPPYHHDVIHLGVDYGDCLGYGRWNACRLQVYVSISEGSEDEICWKELYFDPIFGDQQIGYLCVVLAILEIRVISDCN